MKMKKQVIAGMMVLSTVVSFSAHAASLKGGKSVREVLADYTKEVKKYAYEGKMTAADLNLQQSKRAQEKMFNELKLSASMKTALTSMIANSKNKAAAMDSVATVLAAKNLAAGKNDPESVSINNAADASLKLMANADLIGAKKSSRNLSPSELAKTSEALEKVTVMPDQFIGFEKAERDSYTNVANKADELVPKAETYEDAFEQGIEVTQKTDKKGAMEKVDKIIKCK